MKRLCFYWRTTGNVGIFRKEWLSVKTSYVGVKERNVKVKNITLEKYITLVEWKQENSKLILVRVESTWKRIMFKSVNFITGTGMREFVSCVNSNGGAKWRFKITTKQKELKRVLRLRDLEFPNCTIPGFQVESLFWGLSWMVETHFLKSRGRIDCFQHFSRVVLMVK